MRETNGSKLNDNTKDLTDKSGKEGLLEGRRRGSVEKY